MIRATYQLIQAIKKMYPVVQFFKDRYFPDGRSYYSDKVLIESKKQGRKMAPFVIPMAGGIKMETEAYRADEYEAPYISPYNLITAIELNKKAFGEDPNSGRAPADRENELEGEKLDELRNSVLRTQEGMCTQLITSGEIIMKHYATAEDAARGVNYQEKVLRFFDASEGFTNRYKMSKSFKDMTASEKVLEFYKMASILRQRGVKASDIVMTSDVSMLLMCDKEFLEFFDKRRVEIGEIAPKELPEGVTCNGGININGVKMMMFVYDEFYKDDDGSIARFLPEGTIAFLHPNMGETAYGQVTFLNGENFVSYADKIVPRVIADEKNDAIRVQVFSRPVPFVYDWESWLVTNINDEVDSVSTASLFSGDAGTDGTGVELWSTEKINSQTTKAPLIEYAESIGLTGLNSEMTVQAIKDAILNYQEENYPDGQ